MGKAKIVFLSTAIIVLMVILSFFVFSLSQITSQVTINHYSYTKAICDDSNYCEDYEITCENEDVISMNPTGSAVKFSEDWQDPRNEEIIKKIC